MKHNNYIVTLTNGIAKQTYSKSAFTAREAIILAQAEAIQMGRGYELISCEVE